VGRWGTIDFVSRLQKGGGRGGAATIREAFRNSPFSKVALEATYKGVFEESFYLSHCY